MQTISKSIVRTLERSKGSLQPRRARLRSRASVRGLTPHALGSKSQLAPLAQTVDRMAIRQLSVLSDCHAKTELPSRPLLRPYAHAKCVNNIGTSGHGPDRLIWLLVKRLDNGWRSLA